MRYCGHFLIKAEGGARITNVITLYRYPGDPLPSFSCSERDKQDTRKYSVGENHQKCVCKGNQTLRGLVCPIYGRDIGEAMAALAAAVPMPPSLANQTLYRLVPTQTLPSGWARVGKESGSRD